MMIGAGDDGPPAERVIFVVILVREKHQGMYHLKGNADPATVRVVLSGPTQD